VEALPRPELEPAFVRIWRPVVLEAHAGLDRRHRADQALLDGSFGEYLPGELLLVGPTVLEKVDRTVVIPGLGERRVLETLAGGRHEGLEVQEANPGSMEEREHPALPDQRNPIVRSRADHGSFRLDRVGWAAWDLLRQRGRVAAAIAQQMILRGRAYPLLSHRQKMEAMSPDERQRTVLIVEDDADMMSLLGDELLEAGYRIVEAETAAEATRRIGESIPDLIVTDLQLPQGGLDYLRRLRGLVPSCPIILLTAFGGASVRADALERGVSAYFDKPVQMAELRASVERLLDAGR
jgi:CheY-like chemotaxis protein